jgi:hypothetical protein
MRNKAFTFFAFLSVFLTPLIATAHPGHGETDGFSIIHYFTEPVHAAALFSGIALIAGYLYYRLSAKKTEQAKN